MEEHCEREKVSAAAGAAAVHIEDQVAQKRCGHRPNKAIVSSGEMVDRVKAAADAKTNPGFVLMARTDALQSEGLSGVIDRACAYVEAGPTLYCRSHDGFGDVRKVYRR